MSNINYYEDLGVPEMATAEEIKKVYRELVKKYHPDTHPDDPGAEAKMKEINEAHSVLSDSQKKESYDMQRNGSFNGAGGGSGLQEEIMNFFFRRSTPSQERRIRVNAVISISLLEVLQGIPSKKIVLRLPKRQEGKNGTFSFVEAQYEITMDIPPGAGEGMVMETAIEFNKDKYQVLIHFELQEDTRFKPFGDRSGHLLGKLEVPYPTVILGGSVQVELLDGTKEMIKIPAHTQPGRLLRVKEQGLPQSPNNLTRGHLFFEIHVQVPSVIDDETKQLLTALQAKLAKPSTKPESK